MAKTEPQRVSERYAADNLRAATIIVAEPDKYPGLQEWAERTLAKATQADAQEEFELTA